VTLPRLSFLGTGYLGATYAICFAELGYEVLGFDVDEAKIAKLAAGEVPFHEPGLDELLRKNLANGRLRFSTDYAETAEFGDVHFICVGTPQHADGMNADLTYVEAAVTGLTPHLTRHALVVGSPAHRIGWVCTCGARLVDSDGEPAAAVPPPYAAHRELGCESCGRVFAYIPDAETLEERSGPRQGAPA